MASKQLAASAIAGFVATGVGVCGVIFLWMAKDFSSDVRDDVEAGAGLVSYLLFGAGNAVFLFLFACGCMLMFVAARGTVKSLSSRVGSSTGEHRK